MNEEAYVDVSWLSIDNYKFKILIMVAYLAEDHLSFKGRLREACDFLQIAASSKNIQKIKTTVMELLESGEIVAVEQKGYNWTITISIDLLDKINIINLKKSYIKSIQEYKNKHHETNTASWENIVKVLIYLCSDKREIKSYREIAYDLNVSEATVQRSIQALLNIDFDDLIIKKKLAWIKLMDDEYRVIGTKFTIGYEWDK